MAPGRRTADEEVVEPPAAHVGAGVQVSAVHDDRLPEQLLDLIKVRLAVDVPLRHHGEGVRAVHGVVGFVDVHQPPAVAQRLPSLPDGPGVVGLNPGPGVQ